MDNIFNELEQFIDNYDENDDYNLLLSYLILLRRTDNDYIYSSIEKIINDAIDFDCSDLDKVHTSSDFTMKDGIDSLKSQEQLDMFLKLKSLKSNPEKLKVFIDEIYSLYIDRVNFLNDSDNVKKCMDKILKLCSKILRTVMFDNKKIYSFDGTINYDVAFAAYEHLRNNMMQNRELYLNDIKFKALSKDLEVLQKCFDDYDSRDSSLKYAFGYKLMVFFFEYERKLYEQRYIDGLSDKQVDFLIDSKFLIKNGECVVINYKKIASSKKFNFPNENDLNICVQINNNIRKIEKYSVISLSDNAIYFQVCDIISKYISNTPNFELLLRDFSFDLYDDNIFKENNDWNISEEENFRVIYELLGKIYEIKLTDYQKLEQKMGQNSISNNIFKTVFDFEKSAKMIYLLCTMRKIECDNSLIYNLSGDLENFVFSRSIDIDLLKSLYDSKKKNCVLDDISYGILLANESRLRNGNSTDLISYLMFNLDENGNNLITYDSNFNTLVTAWNILIFYELANSYSEEVLRNEINNYIAQLRKKEEKLDVYYTHSGLTALDYKIYCSIRRKQIDDEIESMKLLLNKPTSFISYILSKYTSLVCGDSNLSDGEIAISEIKKSINSIYLETFSTLKYGSKLCVDPNGESEEYDVEVVKQILNEIVQNNHCNIIDKVEMTFKYIKMNILYNMAKKNCKTYFIMSVKSKIETLYAESRNNLIREIDNSRIINFSDILNGDFLNYDKILEKLNEKKEKCENGLFKNKKLEVINNMISLTKLCINYSAFIYKLNSFIENDFYSSLDEDYKVSLHKVYSDSSIDFDNIMSSLIADIDFCLQNDMDSCDFTVSKAIKSFEDSYNIFSSNVCSFVEKNKVLRDNYPASTIELHTISDFSHNIGKKITDTINLLKNQNNFLIILSLAAGYDDTLKQISLSDNKLEVMSSINPIVTKKMEEQLPLETRSKFLSMLSIENSVPALLSDENFDFDEDNGFQKRKKLG